MEQVSSIPISIVTLHGISSFPGADDIWFSLRNTTYQNNSIVTLEDIGEGGDALLCITNYTACCQPLYTGETVPALGNWYFPNGTSVPTMNESSHEQWDFYSSRGQSVVGLNRRRGGEEGIYSCETLDAVNVTQTLYIRVYSASTGEWFMFTPVLCSNTASSSCAEESTVICNTCNTTYQEYLLASFYVQSTEFF